MNIQYYTCNILNVIYIYIITKIISILSYINIFSYIGLIKLNLIEESKIFFSTYFNDHIDYYHNELQLLSTLTSKEQLSSEMFLNTNQFM